LFHCLNESFRNVICIFRYCSHTLLAVNVISVELVCHTASLLVIVP
jgi:hypothetical protein